MLDYREQIQSIYEFIKRSEDEQKYPYAYEIYLVTGVDETALTSRTAGTEKFNRDIESAIEKAKQSHGTLRVDVFGGKSPNARSLNSYTINVSKLLNPPKEPIERAELQTIIQQEVKQQQIQNNTNGLGELDTLLGLFSGENEQAKNKLEGLFGVFNALSGNNKEVERISYQKQLDDFKFETRYNTLEEKFERLRNENAELRAEKDRYQSENRELKSEKTDLENRLAGYAPNEVMKRVATGALVGIGSRILTNSPKTAELLGLTAEELKGALGMVDDSPEESAPIPDTNVEITDMGSASSPEDKKKAEIIKNLSDALMTWELQDVAKIANIVGLCLDKAELINKTLAFLNQTLQGIEQTDGEE
ncbi:hypothetical protein KDU71_14105 [Carboxylicivirga sediminis]|uniref:Uncharacterized protein n=1 Tax=Carboxylicivirga sediminis TaxID=2006564 RepID=A0A941F7F7_9BACT|nr:hypothetical protein [Carboxylicivirga sediminis]MBR8536705.1 hypothetical protein [Carboxylicivirga sediminis]